MLATDEWYAIEDDARGRWALDDIYNRQGVRVARPTDAHPALPLHGLLTCSVLTSHRGLPVDMTFTPGGIPILTAEIGARLSRACGEDVRLVPVQIVGSTERYVALDVLARPRCLVADATRGLDQQGRLVDLREGMPVVPIRLVIDEEAAAGHQIVRPADYPRALLVRASVRALFHQERATGVRFTAVGSR